MSLMANRKAGFSLVATGRNSQVAIRRSQVAGRRSQFALRNSAVAIRNSQQVASRYRSQFATISRSQALVCSRERCGGLAQRGVVWSLCWMSRQDTKPRLLAPGVRCTEFVLSSNSGLPWSRLSKERDQKLQHSRTRPPRPRSPTTTPVQGRQPDHVNTPAGARKDIAKSDKMRINLSIAQLHTWA
jgi:hypothetical protein